ncbi:MAG: HD-GYP domain-containing protein [Rhodocyclaceae bacterium]|nr:HD-GYP domain-containing protein [Rhodocyclaceae bacterium]
MQKKIPIERLKRGMYIQDICGDWMSHPFWRRSFLLKNEADVARFREAGIREVYIDTARGLDDAEGVAAAEVQQVVQQEIEEAVEQAQEPARERTLAEEMPRARGIHAQANRVVRDMMRDVRLGRAVSLENVEPLVDAVTESILSNGNALLGLVGIKNKDDYTFQHSVSVCTLMITFGRSIGLAGDELREAGIGGLVHDIGKMLVPEEVLNKPGRLSDEEFALIRRHPGDGHEILLGIGGVGEVALDITRHHHERIDGSGYPDRLEGTQISTMAKMAAIVDVYDAITADRCYHKGMPATEALRKMWEWSANHFDRKLLASFMRCVGIYPIGSLVRLESGRLGVVIAQSPQDALKPMVRVFFNTRANAYVTPEVINLESPRCGDRIVSDESPRRWKIDPQRFMDAVAA